MDEVSVTSVGLCRIYLVDFVGEMELSFLDTVEKEEC